jgi:carboxypeptidase PM20D1
MKPILVITGFALLGLVFLILIRTFGMTSKQIPPGEVVTVPFSRPEAAERLASSIRYKTISHSDPSLNQISEFESFIEFLEESYPLLHADLEKEVVGGYSLLYTWTGEDPELKPILLYAHYDVVPVEPGTEENWTYPPFSGEIAEGFIWGRGTLDDKSAVFGILEAVEILLSEGARPKRTIYLVFGHDEEVGGREGAKLVADLLGKRGVELEFALDEGLSITEGIVPNLSQPAAMIGIAHKGYTSLELSVTSSGGHSSMPPKETSIGILAAAVHRLENNPLPARMDGPGVQVVEALAPHMSFTMRMVFANQWLFRPIIEKQMAASPSTNASIRTTTAATMFEAGVKENVLPTRGRAVVNFRIMPGDSVASVVEHARKAVNDPRVEILPLAGFGSEPSPVSPTGTFGYRSIEASIRTVFPEVLVAPGLVLGAVDLRHFEDLSDNLYRFSPIWLDQHDLDRLHGLNERISFDHYGRMVEFYYVLITKSAFEAGQTE